MNEITNNELDTMFDWYMFKMEFDKWYAVKSQKAVETLKFMIQYENVNDLVFSENFEQIKKVDWDFHTEKFNFNKKVSNSINN